MFTFLLTHSPLLYFTQSLWRDEAFSILTAERPLRFILTHIKLETPLYYILLHFWMKIFGEGEIAVRSLSLLAFLLSTAVIIVWSEKLFKKHFLSWTLPLFFFLNPMILYYAFEARAYAWYVLFSVLSLYGYVNKKWALLALSTVLGFYTHSYFILVPFVETIHYFITEKPSLSLWKNSFVKAMSAAGLLILPWLMKIAFELRDLKSAWYFPVNFGTVLSALGNMFIGYEGTPWYLWGFTAFISLVMVFLFLIALYKPHTKKRNSLFLLIAILPLASVLGISFIKPLFVNRYLIPVTVGEIMLLAFAVEAVQNRFVQIIMTVTIIAFSLFFDTWYPPMHAKLDIRGTILQVNALKTKNDVIFADSPLIFFETLYYSKNRSIVYLYNPIGNAFPWYVGDIIVSRSQFAREFPPYPIRAFLVHGNGTYDIVYQTDHGTINSVSVTKP